MRRATHNTECAHFCCIRISRANSPEPCGFGFFTCAKCAGKMIKDSISENTKVDITTMEMARVNWRASPSISIHGLNEIMVTNTDATSGFSTICVAKMALSPPVWPRSARS